jgi:hypothetical protein
MAVAEVFHPLRRNPAVPGCSLFFFFSLLSLAFSPAQSDGGAAR